MSKKDLSKNQAMGLQSRYKSLCGPVIDPYFGHWFAGFVDGEGCFLIPRIGKSYRCIFNLHLRRDDRPILEEIHSTLEIGKLWDLPSYSKRLGNRDSPSTRWEVTRKQEIIVLQDVFRTFPLRAKKTTDFAIWSKAVDEWKLHTNRWDAVSWDSMIALKQQLQESRKYTEDDNGEDTPV